MARRPAAAGPPRRSRGPTLGAARPRPTPGWRQTADHPARPAGRATGDCDRPYRRVVLQSLAGPEVLAALAAPGARETLVTPPLTTDHLIRTKALPLWVEGLRLRRRGGAARAAGRGRGGVLARTTRPTWAGTPTAMPAGVEPFAPQPRVVMIPGLGVFCAGPDLREAVIARDITEHTIAVKAAIAAGGCARTEGLPEDELFAMEYRTLQHAKLARRDDAPLCGGTWPW